MTVLGEVVQKAYSSTTHIEAEVAIGCSGNFGLQGIASGKGINEYITVCTIVKLPIGGHTRNSKCVTIVQEVIKAGSSEYKATVTNASIGLIQIDGCIIQKGRTVGISVGNTFTLVVTHIGKYVEFALTYIDVSSEIIFPTFINTCPHGTIITNGF